jgi:hypothetical protein
LKHFKQILFTAELINYFAEGKDLVLIPSIYIGKHLKDGHKMDFSFLWNLDLFVTKHKAKHKATTTTSV